MSNKITNKHGELAIGENHPAAHSAFIWVKNKLLENPMEATFLQESFASVALSGDRTAELCCSTLQRILTGKPVGERYLLGLAWIMKEMEKLKNED